MFGYIRADKPNMLIKDFAVYKAYYCGVCKTLGRRYSQFTRLLVNFDIAMLNMMAHNYANLLPVAEPQHCVIHPVGKKFLVLEEDEVQNNVADINVILAYHKINDDIADGGGVNRKSFRAFLKPEYKKAVKKFPYLDKKLTEIYKEIATEETKENSSVEKLVNLSGDMLVEIGRAACPNPDSLLDEFCANLGKWIYLIDAFDDLVKDSENGSFNPFIEKGTPLTETLINDIANMVQANLYNYISHMKAIYDRMNIMVDEGPLSNVIYKGLKTETDRVLANKGKKQKSLL